MNKADHVPEWAIKRAVELAGFPVQVDDENRPLPWRQSLYNAGLDAFARYIAAHEPAPVDPIDLLRDSIEALHGISFDRDKMKQIVARSGVSVTLEPTREGERGV